MPYKDITPPAGGKITRGQTLNVPDNPILPFIRGDGTGPDIWAASVRVFDAAVEDMFTTYVEPLAMVSEPSMSSVLGVVVLPDASVPPPETVVFETWPVPESVPPEPTYCVTTTISTRRLCASAIYRLPNANAAASTPIRINMNRVVFLDKRKS